MKLKFKITGLDCPNCAAKLAERMQRLEGIESASIHFLAERLTVQTSLEAEIAYQLLSQTAAAFEAGVKLEK